MKYLVLSDIHLGHKNNKTINIVNNLKYFFKVNHKSFKTLDVIFVAGDIFDRLLSPNSEEYILAVEWITELAVYCKVHNIKLRILEGTPSHDWKQARVVESVLDRLELTIDFKYIQTLMIERMDDLKTTILYVPDEYKHKSSETLVEVRQLLNKEKLEQVDIAIMHGQFNYQLPIMLESSHDETSYLDIVKYFISIGHIHTSSVFQRIVAQGSFDRLTHGEEETKGAMLLTTGINPTYEFIPNTRATIFKTVDIRSSFHHLETIVNAIKGLPKGSFIRVLASKGDDVKNTLKELQSRYIDYTFKIMYDTKDDEVLEAITVNHSDKIDTFAITPVNIKELLLTEVTKHNLSSKLMNKIEEELVMATA